MHDNGDITQTLKGTSKGYETIFIRNKENGSWSGWVEQTSEDNILDHIKAVDGSGSGLDADKLDGHHASDFVYLSQLKDKIKLIDGSGSGLTQTCWMGTIQVTLYS